MKEKKRYFISLVELNTFDSLRESLPIGTIYVLKRYKHLDVYGGDENDWYWGMHCVVTNKLTRRQKQNQWEPDIAKEYIEFTPSKRVLKALKVILE